MSVFFVVQLGFGLHGFVNSDELIGKWLNDTLYAGKDQAILKNAFIATQSNVCIIWPKLINAHLLSLHLQWIYRFQHQCCGVNKPSDWVPILGNKKPVELPSTCCKWTVWGPCTAKNAHQVGCKAKMNKYVQEYYIVWFALAFAVINLIQVHFLLIKWKQNGF